MGQQQHPEPWAQPVNTFKNIIISERLERVNEDSAYWMAEAMSADLKLLVWTDNESCLIPFFLWLGITKTWLSSIIQMNKGLRAVLSKETVWQSNITRKVCGHM